MKRPNREWMEQIMTFINEYWDKTQLSPVIREIEAGTGISRSAVSRYLLYMRDLGMLDYSGYRSIVTEKMRRTHREMVDVPVLRAVPGGIPPFAEENIQGYVQLPVRFTGPGEFFLLRACDGSMADSRIGEGDLVLVRRQETAQPGQLVMAVVEHQAVLRRYHPSKTKKHVWLLPDNPKFPEFCAEDCVIQGVAVKSMKTLVDLGEDDPMRALGCAPPEADAPERAEA